jgi:hypothetical protein
MLVRGIVMTVSSGPLFLSQPVIAAGFVRACIFHKQNKTELHFRYGQKDIKDTSTLHWPGGHWAR